MKILGISVAEGWSESSSVAKYIAVNQGAGAGFWVDGILSRLLMRKGLFCCNCRKNPACEYFTLVVGREHLFGSW